MSEHYKFFQHKECEYFPCHTTEDIDQFNCLFCYCPLYFIAECGGNNVYNNNIKICTNCSIPHIQNGYDHIVNKLIEINKEKRCHQI
jgi:Zn-finger protein